MLSAPVTTDSAALAASLADWWALAGVDAAVQDLPRDWLAKLRPAPAPGIQQRDAAPAQAPATRETTRVAEPEPAPLPPLPPVMPATLDAFMTWLADADMQPESAFSPSLVMPQVMETPPLLIVTDMPATEGQLFSAQEAALIAAMVRAVGLDMSQVALASLLLARPAGGIVERQLALQAGARLNHLLTLIRPPSVLLLGDATERALEQASRTASDAGQPSVNQDDGTIRLMHLPTPSVLLKHSSRKAAAWTDLRRLAALR